MAPTRAHTCLPVALEQANLRQNRSRLSATAHETLVSPRFLRPCVTKDTPVSTRIRSSRAAGSHRKSGQSRSERANQRETHNEWIDGQTHRRKNRCTDGWTDGRTIGRCNSVAEIPQTMRRNLITPVYGHFIDTHVRENSAAVQHRWFVFSRVDTYTYIYTHTH